jgi:hypothetical protein
MDPLIVAALNEQLHTLDDFQALQSIMDRSVAAESELECKVCMCLSDASCNVPQIARLDESVARMEGHVGDESTEIRKQFNALRSVSESLHERMSLPGPWPCGSLIMPSVASSATKAAADMQGQVEELAFNEKLFKYTRVLEEANALWSASRYMSHAIFMMLCAAQHSRRR